jgi:hypothetical protein
VRLCSHLWARHYRNGRLPTSVNVRAVLCSYSRIASYTCTSSLGICFGTNSTILKLNVLDTPSKPCSSCTKQWCLNQNLAICAKATLGDTDPDTATGKEGDVEARCFRESVSRLCEVTSDCVVHTERDSPRDQLVVTLYLLTVFGLLLGAGVKSRMRKAGIDSSALPWHNSTERWQVGPFLRLVSNTNNNLYVVLDTVLESREVRVK